MAAKRGSKMLNRSDGLNGSRQSVGRHNSTQPGYDTDAFLDRGSSFLCVACSKPVLDDKIGGIECVRCRSWCHGTKNCTGLPREFIVMLMKIKGRCVAFHCMNCQNSDVGLNNPDSEPCEVLPEPHVPSSELGEVKNGLAQLALSVVNLTESVKNLTVELANVKSDNNKVARELGQEIDKLREEMSMGGGVLREKDSIRDTIREEVKELHNRDKRANGIIIKGIQSNAGFKDKFNEVVASIWPESGPINLVEVFPIRADMVRAKIVDYSIRNELLNRSRDLRHTGFSSVFISRDLTFIQRKELMARRSSDKTTSDLGGGRQRISHRRRISVGPIRGNAVISANFEPLGNRHPVVEAGGSQNILSLADRAVSLNHGDEMGPLTSSAPNGSQLDF